MGAVSEPPPPRVPDAVRRAMRENPAIRHALARLPRVHRADAGRAIAQRIEAEISARLSAPGDGDRE
jgi:hypothetical protein